ncbi:Hsp70 family protein [Actinoplanes hulinensis]|uniref:Hsp70 family protein n=1 Tax=Actinoplanes hulinensis TaxID=1144547 RepID=UPI001FEB2EA6|nr:Hsp70 family protein [Actinoplanes hulinensis]
MPIDQGGPKRYALGVDFGTSNTVAVARWPDGRARPILVDGSPLLPSAVFADSDGSLLVGRDAVHSARLDPARFEPNPKRRVDDGLVLLGEREFETVELIAAVLARVAEEWHRAVGPHRPEVTLTCPATWGAARRTLLAEAAARAGLEGARLVAEPVAAATYFAEVLGRDVPIGSVVVVHDFGAGTFDTSVVARTSSGFEVLAVDGRDDLGGLDVDAAVVEHLRTGDWARLMEPSTVEERRARRQLWDDVRIAKERLSRAQAADFVVPLLDIEAHLTREELETVARPVLEQTVEITRNLLRWADLPDGRLAGVFLVGGASRIPLVATLLHRALGDPPVVIEQPELVVAEGSILAGAALLTTEPAAPGPTEELRLPSKYLPARAEEDGPTVLAAPPVEREPEAARTEVVERDQPTVLASPADVADESVAKEPVPASPPGPVEADRPTVLAGKPLTTPVPAVPSATAVDVPALPGAGRAESPPHHRPRADGPPPRQDRPSRPRPPADTPPHLLPPVDPWPHAADSWRSDPDATVATSPPEHESRTPVPPRQPRQPGRVPRPQQPVVAHARPVSPAVGSARPVSPPARAVVSAPQPQPNPQPQPRPARVRRRGRLSRAIQMLLSMIVMVTVPIVALILAYGYGNGEPFDQDAVEVFTDIGRLLGL